MTNEREERIIFMAEGIEGSEPKVSLEHPERGKTERGSRGSGNKDVRPHGGGQPPERRAVPPAPPKSEHTLSIDESEPVKLPTAPEKSESPEEQAERERQAKIVEHIVEGRDKEAFGMMFEDSGLNPEEEFAKPEVQKILEHIGAFREEMSKEEKDFGKLEAASEAFKGAPKHIQDMLRTALRAQGMDEEAVRRLLPEIVAPTEGDEEQGLEAPTEGDGQKLTEEEETIQAEVKPFVQSVEDRVAAGDMEGARDAAQQLMDMLKKVPLGKIAGRSLQAMFYTAMATYVAYIFLMAKTSGIAGKK